MSSFRTGLPSINKVLGAQACLWSADAGMVWNSCLGLTLKEEGQGGVQLVTYPHFILILQPSANLDKTVIGVFRN